MTDQQQTQHTPEQKVRILKLHLEKNRSVSNLCERYGINPQVFYRWRKKYREDGEQAFLDDAHNAQRRASAADCQRGTTDENRSRGTHRAITYGRVVLDCVLIAYLLQLSFASVTPVFLWVGPPVAVVWMLISAGMYCNPLGSLFEWWYVSAALVLTTYICIVLQVSPVSGPAAIMVLMIPAFVLDIVLSAILSYRLRPVN